MTYQIMNNIDNVSMLIITNKCLYLIMIVRLKVILEVII